jgi:hypothetical protein
MKSYLTSHKTVRIQKKIDTDLFESMHELFTYIGIFWENTPENVDTKTELFSFMTNRIALDSNYLEEYRNAQFVLNEIIDEYHGNKNEAYAYFFTAPEGLETPPKNKLAMARQKVSNEFIAFQLSIGGFAAFGATNYPGYIAGAYVPGEKAPYRT